uniref:Peptidase A2 domain-containing protein n=1 Tax=Romanomermis culicivorax TaxID=13658 RepID=A0A915HW82_ROMCU
MPCFNPTAALLPLEQHFYRLPAPRRSAADTTAHSSGPAISSQSKPDTNMVAAWLMTANTAMGIRPCIVGWDSTKPQGQLPWDFCLAICNTNEVPSANDALRKYTRTNAFHFPVKIGSINMNALSDTGAQCSIISSSLMKHAFNKKMLTLPVCLQIKVANSAIVQAHEQVFVNMESELGNYAIQCVVLNNDTQFQFIIRMDFLVHPKINTLLIFKEEFIKIGNKCLLL